MKCPVCDAAAFEGIPLVDGKIVHSGCFQQLAKDIEAAEQLKYAWEYEARSLRSVWRRFAGPINRLLSKPHGGHREELHTAEERLSQAESYSEFVRNRATRIYDLVADYPPDWSGRREEVVSRDKTCFKCGSKKRLHVHHVVPLSKGGTNRIENLRLLCSRCHLRTHGVERFSGTNSASAFPKRIQLIVKAIVSGVDIEFGYRKFSDKGHKTRRVTPYDLVELPHERKKGSTLCLEGYCHLRKADRTFALKRMRGLKIL